jgi:hypothetical protein
MEDMEDMGDMEDTEVLVDYRDLYRADKGDMA